MCTSIVEIADAQGSARSRQGWFPLTRAVVAYDHPQHALLEEAVTIDFVNPARGASARAAVELTLQSARALHAALAKVIDAAQAEENAREAYAGPAHPHSRKREVTAARHGESRQRGDGADRVVDARAPRAASAAAPITGDAPTHGSGLEYALQVSRP